MLQINPFLDCTIYSGIVVHIGRNNHLFAGIKSGNSINPLNDGVLTSNEISELDLSGVDLIVLSACETGLGEIQGSEGVFGLQRAFKLAGAKSLILSLWKVPDSETSELMTLFYKYYLSGLTANEALKKAQNEIRKRFPDDPYYWAAFFVVD
jgi:CHAT domain-containing protein